MRSGTKACQRFVDSSPIQMVASLTRKLRAPRRLIRVVSGGVGAGEGACGTAAVHGRRTRGGQVDDRAVAVTGGDDVVRGVVQGAVLDDETAGAGDLDAAIVEGDVVSFDAVAQ